MSPFTTKSILYFTFLFLFNKSNAYGFNLGIPSVASVANPTAAQTVVPASVIASAPTSVIASAPTSVIASAPTSVIASTPAPVIASTSVITSGPAIIPTVVNAVSSPSTVVNAAEALCTRTQCYEKLATTVGNNIERVIMTETTNQVTYLNSVVSNKLSSAMGPAIAVAMKAGPISSKINNGEYIAASGIATEAVGMYYVGAQGFLFCSANSAFLGPYAIIPGFICAGIASAVAENTLYDIKTSLFVPTPKPTPNHNHYYNNNHY